MRQGKALSALQALAYAHVQAYRSEQSSPECVCSWTTGRNFG